MQTLFLSPPLAEAVRGTVEDWLQGAKARRLWARDASLWTGADEARWLGWLHTASPSQERLKELRRVAEEARGEKLSHVLLLGMGGSSLCAEVLSLTLGPSPGFPPLSVLDSVDPAQVLSRERAIDPRSTLFVVSSKSGTTLEPELLRLYFLERLGREIGAREAGRRFIAITDPGSQLEVAARQEGFREVFHGVPEIGGRYSALSAFGMVPAALSGLDTGKLLGQAARMASACGPDVPAPDNPAVVLGAVLGTLARRGRDKVTILASPAIEAFGAWLEQLLAESTGKRGRGLIPVDREAAGAPGAYGEDRVIVHLRFTPRPEARLDSAVEALRAAGHPVVRISIEDPYQLGGEFFRWEMATAVAGSVLGINPFDQPDVEASKIAARELTAEYERSGRLPPESPLVSEGPLEIFSDPGYTAELARGAGGGRGVREILGAHLAHLGPGDYFALLAYVEMNGAHRSALEGARLAVRDARRVATCLGFGPRYLHSTGQAYKGGPDTGVFLLVTAEDGHDVPVPGRRLTLGAVKAAQALGDFRVLAERGRRALRIHLRGEAGAGLAALREEIAQVLA